MKRILCVLITLFTFIGYESSAQQIMVDIGSATGQVGDVVSIPIEVHLPLGSQGITTCQGAIVSSNPAVAEIIGATVDPSVPMGTNIINPGAINFSGSSPQLPFNLPNDILMTLEVKIMAPGCSSFDLSDIVTATGLSSIEFFVDGVIYDDLATDFLVNSGTVCSSCGLHITNLDVYPENQSTAPTYVNSSGSSSTNYSDYTSACIPYNVAPNVVFDASQSNVYMAMYLDNNNDGIFEVTILSGFNSAGILQVQFPTGGLNYNAGLRIVVSDQPITDPTNIPTCGEVEDYVFCGDCACDLNDVVLGPFEFIQNSQGFCSSYIVNIPPVTGCSNVDVSYNYYFEVFNSTGNLVYSLNTTQDGFIYDFPVEGDYTFVVTYTIVDISGCEQQVQYSENFEYTGCPCACDLNDLTLGPFEFIQNSQGFCSSYIVNIPPVVGCSDVDVSYNYYFEVFNSAGNLVYSLNTTQDGFIYDFPVEGQYTFVVTYTIVDILGCTQTLSYEEKFNYVSCDCQILGPPTFTDCQPGINPNATFHTLFWTAVSGAVSYEVEIVLNDPTCCPNSTDPMLTFIFPRTSTSMSVQNGRCYSWRVRSVCANGTRSDWSSRSCSCGTKGGSDGSSTKSFDLFDEGFDARELRLVAVPNPAKDHVNITLTGWSNDSMINDPEIIIQDMSGRVVYGSQMTLSETTSVDVSSFMSGVYIVTVVDSGITLSTEKLIIE